MAAIQIVLAFSFIHVLPGLSFVLWVRRKERNIADGILEAGVTSLALTIWLGLALNFLGLMTPLACYVLMLVFTGFVIAGLYRFPETKKFHEADLTAGRIAHGTILVLGLFALTGPFIGQSGRIIISWDALIGWKAYADAFADDGIAKTAGHYPQGLPALGAVLMDMTGLREQTLWLRQITNVFPAIGVLALGALFRKAHWGSFAALVCVFLYVHGQFEQISDGYAYSFTADMFVYVAIIGALAAIRMTLLDEDFRPAFNPGHASAQKLLANALWIGLAASLAANAKQLGAIMLITAPVCALLLTTGRLRARLGFAVLTGLVCGVFGGGWYVYVIHQMMTAPDTGNTAFLLDGVHQGRTYSERAMYAVENAEILTGGHLLLIALTGFGIASVFTRFGQILMGVALIPTLAFYLFIGGYAARNFTPVLAILMVCSGIGLIVMFRMMAKVFPFGPITRIEGRRLRSVGEFALPLRRFALGGFAFIALLITVPAYLYSGHITAWADRAEIDQSRHLGFGSVNSIMEKSMEARPDGEVIYTNYQMASRLPQLRQFKIIDGHYTRRRIETAATQTPDLNLFILWYDRAPQGFQVYLECLEESGEYEMINHRDDDTTKWKFMRRNPDTEVTRCDDAS